MMFDEEMKSGNVRTRLRDACDGCVVTFAVDGEDGSCDNSSRFLIYAPTRDQAISAVQRRIDGLRRDLGDAADWLDEMRQS